VLCMLITCLDTAIIPETWDLSLDYTWFFCLIVRCIKIIQPQHTPLLKLQDLRKILW
jgi:hypothetical protein